MLFMNACIIGRVFHFMKPIIIGQSTCAVCRYIIVKYQCPSMQQTLKKRVTVAIESSLTHSSQSILHMNNSNTHIVQSG